MSVNFNRAAETYEATRGFPPGIGEEVADAAVAIVGPGARVVEIGVGTGRIARPVAARGVRVVGVDLSRRMMRQLTALTPPGPSAPRLVEADATRLPLANAAFDAALSVHVLHLIPNWPQAVAELRRVLRPGGVYVLGYDWRPPEAWSARLLQQWRTIVAARGYTGDHPGAQDFADIRRHLEGTGAVVETRLVGAWTVRRTVAQALEAIEHRTWSSTWGVPDDFFPDCLAELRAWAIAEHGSLAATLETPHQFCWECYRWA